MDLIKLVENELSPSRELPAFKSGDTITINYKIKEGNKERIQSFRGVVIQKRGIGAGASFTVRKISNGVGVERIFPMNSPFIESIEINKRGKVRRARLFYLRGLTGKKARIKEKKLFIVEENTETKD
ncbi:MAG: 50S ribosomal protein L19 [Bacteroidales bacterium]|nr:50S ribosomal protein L19 [Bacteroidales bacterium]